MAVRQELRGQSDRVPAVGGKFFACERSLGGASSIKMPAFYLAEVV
jgi:hypothetical protein